MNKIFKTLLAQGGQFLSCFILACILNSCYTTKQATKAIKAYDNHIIEKRSLTTELPPGISLNLVNQLPDSSSAKKTFNIVLPLLFINWWQSNIKLTLGQASLETPTIGLLKSELLYYFEFLGWEVPYQHGYSINIDVHEIEASGVYISGAYLLIGPAPGAQADGDLSQCTRIHSNFHITLNLYHKDSLEAHSDFFLSVEAYESAARLVYRDSQTKKKVRIKSSLPKFEKSFEFLIPAAKEAYYIGIKGASREIVLRVRNLLPDYYSASNDQSNQGFYHPRD